MQNFRDPPPKVDIPSHLHFPDRSDPAADAAEWEIPPGAPHPCSKLAESGDVVGVLAWIRGRSLLDITPDDIDYVAKAIRKGQTRVDDLVDAAYGEAIGFTILLLVRCQLYVERQLAESDSSGGKPAHMSSDLDGDGWLPRIERMTRFLMELTTIRSRVKHVTEINNGRKECNESRHAGEYGRPMGTSRGEAAPGKAASRNGRNGRAEARIVFP